MFAIDEYLHDVNKQRPEEGSAVLAVNSKTQTKEVAFYCDGSFYTLRLDPVLGILRKTYIPDIVYWTDLVL